MSRWIPCVALIGLVCVMLIPAPGLLGITIGVCCVLAIAASAFMMLVDRITVRFVDPLLEAIRRRRIAKGRKRNLHAGSGMTRKA